VGKTKFTVSIDSDFEKLLREKYGEVVKENAGKENISFSRFICRILRKGLRWSKLEERVKKEFNCSLEEIIEKGIKFKRFGG